VVDLCHLRLRSNPRFRLVPLDRLPMSERGAFESSNADPDFFGILTPPPETGLLPKSVSHDAALLFLALAEPSCLPNLLTNLLGAEANQRLRQLVLDQVFEVEEAGQFVTGPAALELLGEQAALRGDSHVARLSSEAIDYAQTLESLQMHQVAARLYSFNTAPSTPSLQRRLGSGTQMPTLLCADIDTERRLRSRWRSESIGGSWSVWSDPTAAAAGYKLYVSPVLDDLPRVFTSAVRSFERVDCPRFKLGKGAYGLLRPDKLVGYFLDLDQLHRAAEMIAASAADAAAQGVPFSAPIDSAGLLSWGMDPPRFDLTPPGHGVSSWRQWLTGRVAAYVEAARQSGGDVQAFVRQRIALDGVYPADWTPNLAIWRERVSAERGAA
jgi:hypothetical protein